MSTNDVDPRSVLSTKRDGGELSKQQIDDFIGALISGEAKDFHASALLMAIYKDGMQPEELFHWTDAMRVSGRVLDFHRFGKPVADKHSTGGIGDKVSLVLAPAMAACGALVPMISGRGLGHTGGTLDKLETIPGLKTELSVDDLGRVLEDVGAVIAAQTEDLVPADRLLYGLRDATALVDSLPLVASSILSKKLAEGLDVLVLDVKYGSGAIFPELERGRELARIMTGLTARAGIGAICLHTAMDRPLGLTIGNALEVRESLACLRGEGPADLDELVIELGAAILQLCGIPNVDSARRKVRAILDDGQALSSFEQMVKAQGGDLAKFEQGVASPDADLAVERLLVPTNGHLCFQDIAQLGWAVSDLGGGRHNPGDPIDPDVGLVLLHRHGEQVAAGEAWIEIHHRAGKGLESAKRRIEGAVQWREEPFEVAPLILFE